MKLWLNVASLLLICFKFLIWGTFFSSQILFSFCRRWQKSIVSLTPKKGKLNFESLMEQALLRIAAQLLHKRTTEYELSCKMRPTEMTREAPEDLWKQKILELYPGETCLQPDTQGRPRLTDMLTQERVVGNKWGQRKTQEPPGYTHDGCSQPGHNNCFWTFTVCARKSTNYYTKRKHTVHTYIQSINNPSRRQIFPTLEGRGIEV